MELDAFYRLVIWKLFIVVSVSFAFLLKVIFQIRDFWICVLFCIHIPIYILAVDVCVLIERRNLQNLANDIATTVVQSVAEKPFFSDQLEDFVKMLIEKNYPHSPFRIRNYVYSCTYIILKDHPFVEFGPVKKWVQDPIPMEINEHGLKWNHFSRKTSFDIIKHWRVFDFEAFRQVKKPSELQTLIL